MARQRLHTDDRILDAARDLWITGGDPTTSAISGSSGAPIGSIYHRFGSRGTLLTELWKRTMLRFHERLLADIERAEAGLPRAMAAAGATVRFAVDQPADARLLLLTRPGDVVDTRELGALNAPVSALLDRLTGEVFGRRTPARRELITVAVVDLPYAMVRRHLVAGTLRSGHASVVANAAAALLGAGA